MHSPYGATMATDNYIKNILLYGEIIGLPLYRQCSRSNHLDVHTCSSSGFPSVGARLVIHHSAVRLLVLLVSIGPCCWAFCSPLFFLLCFSQISLTQSSHLSCGLPRFLQPSCFFVSDLFGNVSSFILIMCPAHFIRLLTTWPTISFSSNFFSLVVYSPSLHSLYSGYSPYIVVRSLRCCSSDRANGSTQESRTVPFSFLEIFRSINTPSTFPHAFAPA